MWGPYEGGINDGIRFFDLCAWRIVVPLKEIKLPEGNPRIGWFVREKCCLVSVLLSWEALWDIQVRVKLGW